MHNPWLSRSKRRNLVNDLKDRFVGEGYLHSAHELSQFAANHPDWQNDFVISAEINEWNEIEDILIESDSGL